jgi:hypothetical protein
MGEDRDGGFGLEEELEDNETNEGFEFPPPERKVITSAYDLSIQTLLEQWEGRILELPEIQRDYVWDDARASRLIESLLLNIPIPVVYFAETADANYEIVDGHQRIKTVVRYLQNQFRLKSLAVLAEYNGKRFFELPEREQRFLRMRTIRAIIISADSHPNMKFEVFERLNTGSIALNAQELRNSLYRGSFNRMLKELVTEPEFRRVIGTAKPRKRMVDQELVLRFFALLDGYPEYRPPLKRFLNEFMESVRDADEGYLASCRTRFTATVGSVDEAFGEGAFRISDARGRPVEKPVVRALFDAQMLTMAHVSSPDLRELRPAIAREMAALYHDQEFVESLRRATGDRARVRYRLERVATALRAAGAAPEIPASWG